MINVNSMCFPCALGEKMKNKINTMKITKYLRVINSNKWSKFRFSQFLNKYYGAYMRGGYNKKMKFENFMLSVINNNSKDLENIK